MINQVEVHKFYKSYIIPSLVFLALVLSARMLGFATAYHDYIRIFFLFAPLLMLLVLRSNVTAIVIALVTIPAVFTFGRFVRIPAQAGWVPELLSGLLFVKAIAGRIAEGRRINLFGVKVAVTSIVITFASLAYNGVSLLSALLFLRLLFSYYLLFLAIINLNIDESSMKLINKVLVFIFLIQLPLSVIKLFLYGTGETRFGLNQHATTTSVGLIAVEFLLSYYLLYRRSMLNILLIFGFVGFVLIGGKRGFIFLMPIVLAYIGWLLRSDIRNNLKYITVGVMVFVLTFYLGVRLNRTLNPQGEIWGEFDLKFVLNKVYSYTTGRTSTGLTGGRVATTANFFNRLRDRGLPGLSLGYGPGCIMQSMFIPRDEDQTLRDQFGAVYGVTGLNWLSIQVGYLGAFAYLSLFYLVLRKSIYYFRTETEPYWRAFGLGVCGFSFVMLLVSLSYAPVFLSESIAVFYFCLAGFVISRVNMRKTEETVRISRANRGKV